MNFAQGMDGIAIIYLLINKAVREAWPKALNAGLSATYVPKKQNLLYCSGAEGHPVSLIKLTEYPNRWVELVRSPHCNL